MANKLRELEVFGEWVHVIENLKKVDESSWNQSIAPGKWSFRDVVSHIMKWDKYFYEEAIGKIAADEPLHSQHLNYDDFNRRAAEYGRGISIAELSEEAIHFRNLIIQTVQELPEEKLHKEYIDGDGHIFHIPTFLRDFIEHDHHHMNDLQSLLT